MKRHLKKMYRFLFANRASQKLNYLLLECSLHGLGVLNFENGHISGESFFLGKTLPRWLADQPEPTFVDVGANVGNYSRMLKQQFPNCRLISVEAHPENFKKLKANLPESTQVLNLAAGAEPGNLVLFDRSDCNGSSHASVYEEVITDFHRQEATQVNVDVEPLDNIASQHDLHSIDLLKIDTEGHEMEVLKGASQLLENQRVNIIQLEFNALHIYSRVFFYDLYHLLDDYHFFRLLPRSMIRIPKDTTRSEIFAFQNIICVHRKFAERIHVDSGRLFKAA